MEIVKVENATQMTDGNVYYELDGTFYQLCWNCGKVLSVDHHITKYDLEHNRPCGTEEAFCCENCEKSWFMSEYPTLDTALLAGEEERAEKFIINPVKVAVLESVGLTAEDIENCEADDSLSVNTGRDGRTYVWYMDETHNVAADAETGEFLTEEEIEKQFC